MKIMKILNYFIGAAWLIISFIYLGAASGWWTISIPPSNASFSFATLLAGLNCFRRND